MAVAATKRIFSQLKGVKWRPELVRLLVTLIWFGLCALAMAIVQIYGDTAHARYVRQPFVTLLQVNGLITGDGTATVGTLTAEQQKLVSQFPEGLIYDVCFHALPHLPYDHLILNPDLMLHSFIAISALLALLHWTPLTTVRRIRRFLCLFGLGYLLRLFSLAFTVLPPSDAACVPIARSLLDSILLAPKLLVGKARTCTDKIFSGHTTVAILLFWFWQDARTARGDRLLSFWRFYAVVHLLMMVVCSVMGHNHYTVDIVVSAIINTSTFWIYRMALLMVDMHVREQGGLPPELKLLASLRAHKHLSVHRVLGRLMATVYWIEGLDLRSETGQLAYMDAELVTGADSLPTAGVPLGGDDEALSLPRYSLVQPQTP